MAGMELLFTSVKPQVKSRNDALMCCLHWNMIGNGFKCIGKGEELPANKDTVNRSEMLPAGWSESPEMYALLYMQNNSDDGFLLKVLPVENTLLVHLMRFKDNEVICMSTDVTEYTTDNFSDFNCTYKNLDALQKRFKEELIDKMASQKAKSSGASLQETRESQHRREQQRIDEDDPLRIGAPRQGYGHPARPDWGGMSDPFAVGRSDLDPFSGGMGGGMLMDPSRSGFGPHGIGPHPRPGIPGQLPRGAVPPGARFDPFGPVGPGGGGAGPDPDHLPAPDYDDMFM